MREGNGKEGIVIDISHASEALFYDVAGNTERPFIATHSNSKVLCKHPRNLTDDQFRIICNRGGLWVSTISKHS